MGADVETAALAANHAIWWQRSGMEFPGDPRPLAEAPPPPPMAPASSTLDVTTATPTARLLNRNTPNTVPGTTAAASAAPSSVEHATAPPGDARAGPYANIVKGVILGGMISPPGSPTRPQTSSASTPASATVRRDRNAEPTRIVIPKFGPPPGAPPLQAGKGDAAFVPRTGSTTAAAGKGRTRKGSAKGASMVYCTICLSLQRSSRHAPRKQRICDTCVALPAGEQALKRSSAKKVRNLESKGKRKVAASRRHPSSSVAGRRRRGRALPRPPVEVYCSDCGRQFAQDFIAHAGVDTDCGNSWVYLERCHRPDCKVKTDLPDGGTIHPTGVVKVAFLAATRCVWLCINYFSFVLIGSTCEHPIVFCGKFMLQRSGTNLPTPRANLFQDRAH